MGPCLSVTRSTGGTGEQLTTRKRLKMYKCILLAYDGSVEGRTALREGALLARQCGADVFLLSVLAHTGTLLLPEAGLAGAFVHLEDDFTDILNEGVARLRKLGFDPTAKLVRGQPAEEIGNVARQIGADLIVVGHRRQSAFDRWWSGPKGAYLMDYTDCSLLVARNVNQRRRNRGGASHEWPNKRLSRPIFAGGRFGQRLKFNSVRFFGGLILIKTSPQNPQDFHPLHAFERLQ